MASRIWAFCLLAVLAIVFGALALTLPGSGQDRGTAAEPAATTTSYVCNGRLIYPVAVKAMRPDGTTQEPRDHDGMARSYEYQDGTHEVVPPPGWSPLTATDQELRTYLFPPRPTDPAALAQWHDSFARYNDQSSKAGSPRCQTRDSAG
jgi:hypothetical protein